MPRERKDTPTRIADWRRMDLALRHARAYAHPAGRIVRIETHISVVYLAGRYAYKVCKPVDLGFVDFTTAAVRLRCCRDALRLNRRLAASLYVSVVPIVRFKGTFKAGGIGTPFDHALKMRRFDERDTFSARLARNALTAGDIDLAADELARFHLHAARHAPRAAFGSASMVSEQLETVLCSLRRAAPSRISGRIEHWYHESIARLQPHFDGRRREGFVRDCHGDLHLANIVRRNGHVACFDCVDFSEALRWIDITADIAFLTMDLLAHERGDLANAFAQSMAVSDRRLCGPGGVTAIRRLPRAGASAGGRIGAPG